MAEGELSRASALLSSKGLAPDSDHTIRRLRDKHPDPASPVTVPDEVAQGLSLKKDIIIGVLKSASRQSAPGPSGLRYEHLKACLSSQELTNLLCSAIQGVAAGSPPPVVGEALAAARLIALEKSNGDVRPIAVGDSLRRLTARAICIQEKDSMCELFDPIQYGVATPGGLDLVVHQVQVGLEAHPDWGLWKGDLKNAFNSVSRQRFIQETAHSLPAIVPFTLLLYSRPSLLVSTRVDLKQLFCIPKTVFIKETL